MPFPRRLCEVKASLNEAQYCNSTPPAYAVDCVVQSNAAQEPVDSGGVSNSIRVRILRLLQEST